MVVGGIQTSSSATIAYTWLVAMLGSLLFFSVSPFRIRSDSVLVCLLCVYWVVFGSFPLPVFVALASDESPSAPQPPTTNKGKKQRHSIICVNNCPYTPSSPPGWIVCVLCWLGCQCACGFGSFVEKEADQIDSPGRTQIKNKGERERKQGQGGKRNIVRHVSIIHIRMGARVG